MSKLTPICVLLLLGVSEGEREIDVRATRVASHGTLLAVLSPDTVLLYETDALWNTTEVTIPSSSLLPYASFDLGDANCGHDVIFLSPEYIAVGCDASIRLLHSTASGLEEVLNIDDAGVDYYRFHVGEGYLFAERFLRETIDGVERYSSLHIKAYRFDDGLTYVNQYDKLRFHDISRDASGTLLGVFRQHGEGVVLATFKESTMSIDKTRPIFQMFGDYYPNQCLYELGMWFCLFPSGSLRIFYQRVYTRWGINI